MAILPLQIGILLTICLGISKAFLIPDGIQKVNTRYGDIVGFIDQVTFNSQTKQVRKFLGIPYAEPPTGNLRFKKPVMKRTLPSPFKALSFGPICPQYNPTNETLSEDCLFLNIYTPTENAIGNKLKPVMIWVHGGGFFSGASNAFGGDVISVFNDVIVVTINYRLNALGFFSTHDGYAKGNYGLWDQHLAFRWVYENIGGFGGDNNNMTIFGESAGSSSVIYQMLYSGNVGIFKRVIAESGTLASWGVRNTDSIYNASLYFGQMLGCNDTIHSKLIKCLQQKPERDVVLASQRILSAYPAITSSADFTWGPVYDAEFVPAKTNTILNELLKSEMKQTYQSFRSFDLMIGANNFDGLVLFAVLAPFLKHPNNSSVDFQLFGEHLDDFVIPKALESWLGEKPTELAIELTKREYTDWDDPSNIVKKAISAAKLFTDFALNAPMIKTANGHTNAQSTTYVYQFSNAPPSDFIETPPEIANDYAANHADELPFVFGFQLNLQGYNGPVLYDNQTRNDVTLSEAVMRMWTNFAKSGNPNHPVSLQSLYDVTWPEYDRTDEYYLEINDKMSATSAKKRLNARAIEFWNNLIPDVQQFSKANS
ncbi:Cocaine esterase [Mactra antiquata]